ncbi:putative metal-dependent membrane protease [Lachnospiraceae bacterium JC7]|nr:putative metal-dependent membrane protease [Lachnospiraceae bacterium JC7]
MEKTSKFKAVGFGTMILVLFLLVQFIAGVIGAIGAIDMAVTKYGENFVYEEAIKEVTPIILCASEVLCIIAFGPWYYFEYVKKDKQNGTYISGISKVARPKTLAFIICSTVAIFSLALLISHTVAALWPMSLDIFDSIMSTALDTDTLYGMITIMLLAPVAEELAFRGVTLKYSRKAFGMWGCIILTMILFAIMHLNPLQSLYVIPISILLAYLAYKFDSVIPAILVHVLNNSLSVLVPKVLNRDVTNTEAVVVMIIFGILAIVFSDFKTVASRKPAISNV